MKSLWTFYKDFLSIWGGKSFCNVRVKIHWIALTPLNRFQYLFSSIRQITNLLQLAVALVVDLGLNKGQSKPNVQCRFQKVSDAMGDVSGLGSSGGSGTLEERRAFLGCFYLTAV